MSFKRIRLYVDTSVVGGCFDDEFKEYSKRLLKEFVSGEKIILISKTLADELELAPQKVKDVLLEIPTQNSESLDLNKEIKRLAKLYQIKGVIPKTSVADALHVAYATYYRADILVSWNFKHIVNYKKIHLVNAVNLEENYQPIEIMSPREVVDYEEKV